MFDVDDDLMEDDFNNQARQQMNDSYGEDLIDEDEDSQRLQAEETVLNNHLECVK